MLSLHAKRVSCVAGGRRAAAAAAAEGRGAAAAINKTARSDTWGTFGSTHKKLVNFEAQKHKI
jgi:hypothetical protein